MVLLRVRALSAGRLGWYNARWYWSLCIGRDKPMQYVNRTVPLTEEEKQQQEAERCLL